MKVKAISIPVLFFIISTMAIMSCKKADSSKTDTDTPIDPPVTTANFWKQISTPYFVNCAETDQSGAIWIGTNQGAYKSADAGKTWVKLSTSGLTTTTKITSIKSNASGSIFAVSGTDLYAYSAATDSWTDISLKMNTSLITFQHMHCFSIAKNGTIYAGMFISQKLDASTIGVDKPVLYRSTNSGQSWSEVKVSQFMGTVKDIAFGSDGTIYVIMDATVYHSTDNGTTWVKAQGGLVPSNPLQLAANSKGAVYAATGSGVFTSTDNGANWINLNYTNYDYTIGINSVDRIMVGSTNRCYYTNDNGKNWVQVSSGLNYSGFDHCYVWAVDKDGYVYVTLESNLYRSLESTTK